MYRKTAISSLKKIYENKSFSNIIVNNDAKLLDSNLRNIYRKTVLGTVENVYFEDYVINMFSSIKTKKLQSEILACMRLAVYQMFFLDNSKNFHVVNESVEYIKKKLNIKASKFVNAILRNILRNKEDILKNLDSLKETDYLEYLSIKYSYPKWLIQKFQNIFESDDIEQILYENNANAKLNIRVNTTKISKKELKERLSKKGIICDECKIADKGLIVENIEDIENIEEYQDGMFSIQSESAMLVGQILNPKEGSFIVDLCSAPGGKSMDAAEIMNNKGSIISRDIYESKISLINNERNRLELDIIKTSVYDASKIDDSLISMADYCIVDVPCSGFGIIRRKPEIKYNRSEPDVDSLKNIQKTILKNASLYLKPGGEMIYSTCTVDPKENIEVINDFLEKNKNFELLDISKETKNVFKDAQKGYISIYPHVHDLDGFFIAKLKKIMI